MRGCEPAGGGVDDHRDPAGGVVEALLEPQPQVLEPVEGALRAGLVLGLVARGEGERFGLDPGHRRRDYWRRSAAELRSALALVVELGRRRRSRPAPRARPRGRGVRAPRSPAAAPAAAASRSKQKAERADRASGTCRRPPRISALAGLAARAADDLQARLRAGRLAPRARARRRPRGSTLERADPGPGRGQRGDPVEHLVGRQLAVAAGADHGERSPSSAAAAGAARRRASPRRRAGSPSPGSSPVAIASPPTSA